MDTICSEQLVKAIEQGMAAAFERSTALCVNEMHRVFDYYNRRWEARRLAGGGVGYESGHAAGQAYSSSPYSGFVWDHASGYYYDAYSGFYYDGNAGLYYDEVGSAEFGIDVGKMMDKLDSVGNVEMGVGYGYEADDFVGVGGVVSDVKESDCVLVSGQLISEPRQFASIGDLGKFHAAGENLDFVEEHREYVSRWSLVSDVGIKKAASEGVDNEELIKFPSGEDLGLNPVSLEGSEKDGTENLLECPSGVDEVKAEEGCHTHNVIEEGEGSQTAEVQDFNGSRSANNDEAQDGGEMMPG